MTTKFDSWLVRVIFITVLMVFVQAAVAQTDAWPAPKSTEPPPNWVEQWVGMYGPQDHPGKNAPPGFKVLNSFDEMGVGGVVATHSMAWANARRDITDFEADDPGMLCKPTGLFIVGLGEDQAFEFLVSPGKITLMALGTAGGAGIATGGVRRIYMNRGHLKNPPLTWNGDSVGHWEGDTLVIDTTGFNDKSWLSNDRNRHSEELHTVERMRFVANGTYLEDIWTIDDPKALTSPIILTRYHKKLPTNTRVAEAVCSDTPESRKLWLKMYKRATDDFEAARAAEAAKAAASQPDSKK
jgi:hypothetical protein